MILKSKYEKKGEQRRKSIMGRDHYLPLLLQNSLTICDQHLNGVFTMEFGWDQVKGLIQPQET